MDENRARSLLLDERTEVLSLLKDTEAAGQADRETEDEEGVDVSDPALSLTAEGMDDAIAESLRERLAAIDRALRRLDAGTYGRSVRTRVAIRGEHLDAGSAAQAPSHEATAQPLL